MKALPKDHSESVAIQEAKSLLTLLASLSKSYLLGIVLELRAPDQSRFPDSLGQMAAERKFSSDALLPADSERFDTAHLALLIEHYPTALVVLSRFVNFLCSPCTPKTMKSWHRCYVAIT